MTRHGIMTRHGLWTRNVMLFAGVLLLGACGTSDGDADGDSGGVASLPSQAPEASVSPDRPVASSTSADPEEAFVEFQTCMEDEGVPPEVFEFELDGAGVGVDDPDGSNGQTPSDPLADVDPELLDQAQQACAPILEDAVGEFEYSPEQEAALEDAGLAFQECMIEQGIDPSLVAGFSDPGGVDVEGDGRDVDPQAEGFDAENFDEEQFTKAAEACQGVFEEVEALFSEEPGQ